MKKINILLVGHGPRGKIWSKVMQKNTKVNLIGICDVNKSAKNKNFLKIPFFTKLENALLGIIPDAIILSTPPFGRMKDLKLCAKYKLPVLVEKPLAVNFKEAEKLINYMSNKKLLLMVGLNFRYLPSTIEKIKLINSNKVGRPNFSKFIYERWRDGKLKRLNKYPLFMKQPMLWEQSIHHFDLIRFIYKSNIKKVFATTFNPPWSMYAHDTNVNALLELENGMKVNYIGNWQSNCKSLNFEWRTDCTKGIIVQKKQFADLNYRTSKSSKFKKIKLKKFKMWSDDANLLLIDFIKKLSAKNSDKSFLSINKDHLNSLSVVDACIKSSKTGKKINLNYY
jgi:predicted dehydrogenase